MALEDVYLHIARTVFHRGCVECPHTLAPCPACPAGKYCSLVATSCTNCAHYVCVKNSPATSSAWSPSATPVAGGESGPNIGAIAGGVIGGVVFIVFATWLIWKFCIKNRRSPYDESFQDDPFYGEKTDSEIDSRRAARASTHTVGSIASTVLTRASNVIQIAYIPGIENRSDTDSPSYIPPVPAISAAHLENTPPRTPFTDHDGSHYFTADDLRDSYADDASAIRKSNFTRQSLTPSLARQSVASTVYRSNAVVSQTPAQQIVRGRPNIVSVKSSPSAGSPAQFPQDPNTAVVDYTSYHPGPAPQNERSLTSILHSATDNTTNNAFGFEQNREGPSLEPSAAGDAQRPTSAMTTLYESASSSEPSLTSSSTGQSSSDVSATAPRTSSPPNARASSTSPIPRNRSASPRVGSPPPANITAVIQEATRRASLTPRHGGLGSVPPVGPSPFGDENAVDR